MVGAVMEECHKTFVSCFHAFYPTGQLKWACLCDLLLSRDVINKVSLYVVTNLLIRVEYYRKSFMDNILLLSLERKGKTDGFHLLGPDIHMVTCLCHSLKHIAIPHVKSQTSRGEKPLKR